MRARACGLVVIALASAAPSQTAKDAPDEGRYLAFCESADAAFARAEREHKRVLVYQDWPT